MFLRRPLLTWFYESGLANICQRLSSQQNLITPSPFQSHHPALQDCYISIVSTGFNHSAQCWRVAATLGACPKSFPTPTGLNHSGSRGDSTISGLINNCPFPRRSRFHRQHRAGDAVPTRLPDSLKEIPKIAIHPSWYGSFLIRTSSFPAQKRHIFLGK